MAKIDNSYHELCENILSNGRTYEDPNRKNVYRIQIPHYSFVHDFKDGFPAITTKKLYWKGVVAELLWFLRGDTNIKYLVDNGINIWNKDAYNYYLKQIGKNNEGKYYLEPMGMNTFLERIKDNKNYEKSRVESYNYKLGDLGRIYGAQWKRWFKYNHTPQNEKVDQITNLINNMRSNPLSTQHIVTAWNPAELDDMALPPCHWSFEILVEPIKYIKGTDNHKYNEISKYQFTLKWHQRSVDTFLGLNFNIASYALLAHIIGKMTNMIPKGIIGNLSNVHIYEPHLDAVNKQLSRDINKYDKSYLELPNNTHWNLCINELLDTLKIEDCQLRNYQSYDRIPAEMLAYNK